mmetsp:Transcript_706/g.1685  ORF Transcript_706/g.1685 Transcript_706/m.1685 type:complete len:372 (+) Transcript_706:422-1537(+)
MTKQNRRSCYEAIRSLLLVKTKKKIYDNDNGDSDTDGNTKTNSFVGRVGLGGVTTSIDGDGDGTDVCVSDIGDNEYTRNSNDASKEDSSTVHYFNHASQAPLSPAVQQIGIDIIRSSPWDQKDSNHSATDCQKRVRSLFAALIDGDNSDEINNGLGAINGSGVDSGASFEGDVSKTGRRIAIFPSTAFAITLAARNIIDQRNKQSQDNLVGDGGRILVLQDQFDSAVYPWQQVCDESKGEISLDIVGHPNDGNHNLGKNSTGDDGFGAASGWTQAVLEKIRSDGDGGKGNGKNNDKIIAACLPPLHWSDGTLLDLEAIGAACRDRDIPLIVDATQGACPTLRQRQNDLLIVELMKCSFGCLHSFLIGVVEI